MLVLTPLPGNSLLISNNEPNALGEPALRWPHVCAAHVHWSGCAASMENLAATWLVLFVHQQAATPVGT
jgi:hypothetical protein